MLEISRGLIVLTKCDLVTDPEWLELVELEAQELVEGTSLEGVPVVRVSAQTGEGLEELKLKLAGLLAKTPPKRDLNRPRLPVDRVFSLSGFGTVVTGTLLDGSFSLGDEVVCLPAGKTGPLHPQRLHHFGFCLLYTSPSPRDRTRSRMPSSACKKKATAPLTYAGQ